MFLRRPMIWMLYAVAAGILTACYCKGANFLYPCAGAFAAVCLCRSRYTEKKGCCRQTLVICLFFIFFLTGALRFAVLQQRYDTAAADAGTEVTVQGTVLQVRQKQGRAQLLLRTEGRLGNVLVICYNERPELFSALEGCPVTASGILEKPLGSRNPNCFDYDQYLRGRGVGVILKVKPSQIAPAARKFSVEERLRQRLGKFRISREKRLLAVLGTEKGALLSAMLFGDKDVLDSEVYEEFQRNGVAHILCVSGIHVSLICLWIEKALTGRRRIWKSLGTIAGLFFYAAAASFSPSVVRAVLMLSFAIVGRLLLQCCDRMTILCTSCFVMLLWNPYQLFQCGFQLSYLAVAALTAIVPWVDARWERFILKTGNERAGNLGKLASPLFVLQIFMAPITAYYFNYFSWMAFLLNSVVILAAEWVIPAGLLLVFLPDGLAVCEAVSLLLQGFSSVISFYADVLISFMVWINHLGFTWGPEACNVQSPTVGTLWMFYGAVFFGCSECAHMLCRTGRRRLRNRILSLILAGACLGAWAAGLAPSPLPGARETFEIVFVDVGQGDCTHIRTPLGKNILIDGGGSRSYDIGKKTLLPYLLKNGVSEIDLAIVTHLHDDHFLGIQQLSKLMRIEKLVIHELNKGRAQQWELQGKKPAKLSFAGAGDTIYEEAEFRIRVLGPDAAQDCEKRLAEGFDENENSLLLAVEYKGFRILETGDMGIGNEEDYLRSFSGSEQLLKADILKIGHHGSRYSTSEAFLQAVEPTAAVIQVGKNNFGHPAPRVIELLRDYDIMIFRNDWQGAVLLDRIDGRGCRIRTML